MKMKKHMLAAAVLAAALSPLASVAPAQPVAGIAYASPAAETQASDAFSVDFKKGCPALFEASDGWTNGNPFNVFWHKSNVTFEDGLMQLIIDNDDQQSQVPYSGGEFRSKQFYGYGRYEVSMKAMKNDGVVSSFFTYTGPSDSNPWSEDFHTYAFEWHKDKIIWFVDGKEAYRIEGANMPVTKGKIMMNAWAGKNVDAWLKAFDDSNLPIMAEYQWVKYTPSED